MRPVSQGTAQVYSPFGSYVVEQHAPAFEARLGVAEPDAAAPPPPQAAPDDTFEVINSPPKRFGGLSSDQAGIGRQLQRYYQLGCVDPTPADLEMLLQELRRRTKADGHRAA
jgi:hypothetical protein